MHILPPIHRDKPIFLAFLALVVLGLSLSVLTWQNLRQQKIMVERHMVLAAKVVSAGVEGNMGWRMRQTRGMHPDSPLPDGAFQDFFAATDIVFAGVIDEQGALLLGLESMEGFSGILEEGLQALKEHGQWHTLTADHGQAILVFARRTRPMLARHFQDRGPAPRHGRTASDQRPFLVLGLDMTEHLSLYHDARRAALWQTGYILGTAGVFWLASLALFRRREQGRRVAELEHFQARLLDNLPDGLVTLDCENVVRSANPAAMDILAGQERLVGRKWSDLPLSRPLEQPSPEDDGGVSWREYRLGNRSLEVLSVALREQCPETGQTLMLIRDRTQVKQLESRLQEAQRLAAIGRLAAGVAHEIRNPLSALRGFAQYFTAKFAGREPELTYARTMVSEADRLNRVVSDLLFLSRPRQPECREISLGDAFEDLRALVQTDLAARSADILLEPDAEHAWADPDLLKQALLNLALNALEALPDKGGVVRISASLGHAVNPESGAEGPGIWISVQDNGRGMDREQREKALEPFYTTSREGAGLGLPMVHRIMRDHGGHMEIESVPGAGCTVRLFFPNRPAPGT